MFRSRGSIMLIETGGLFFPIGSSVAIRNPRFHNCSGIFNPCENVLARNVHQQYTLPIAASKRKSSRQGGTSSRPCVSLMPPFRKQFTRAGFTLLSPVGQR